MISCKRGINKILGFCVCLCVCAVCVCVCVPCVCVFVLSEFCSCFGQLFSLKILF